MKFSSKPSSPSVCPAEHTKVAASLWHGSPAGLSSKMRQNGVLRTKKLSISSVVLEFSFLVKKGGLDNTRRYLISSLPSFLVNVSKVLFERGLRYLMMTSETSYLSRAGEKTVICDGYMSRRQTPDAATWAATSRQCILLFPLTTQNADSDIGIVRLSPSLLNRLRPQQGLSSLTSLPTPF